MKPASPKILCIENGVETGELVTEELAEYGYTVITVHGSESGLAMILYEVPDLVLCNVGMPGMTGSELLEQLRTSASRYTEVPFIFLTVMTQRKSEPRGRRLGASDCMTKPVSFKIPISIVQTRLARRPRAYTARPPIQLSEREAEVLT